MKIPTKLIAIKISIYSNQRYTRALHICTWQQNRTKSNKKPNQKLVAFIILLTLFLPAGTALNQGLALSTGTFVFGLHQHGLHQQMLCFQPALCQKWAYFSVLTTPKYLHHPGIVVFSVCWHTTLRQHCLFFIASRPLGSSPRLTSDLCLVLGRLKIFNRGLHSSFQPFSRRTRQLAAATVSHSKMSQCCLKTLENCDVKPLPWYKPARPAYWRTLSIIQLNIALCICDKALVGMV